MGDPTPMMRQYEDIKAAHRDNIVLFRLGDFYEMFRDDAREASQVLGLTLTQRQGEPMCGFPFHAAAGYIRRLLAAGRKVAVCEQVGEAGAGRGMLRREVVDVLTPGTLIDDGYLDGPGANVTAALVLEAGLCALASADLSTGDLAVTSLPLDGRAQALETELDRCSPRELLVAEGALERFPPVAEVLASRPGLTLTTVPQARFEADLTRRRLLDQFGVLSLQAFGLEDRPLETRAAGALIGYWLVNNPGRTLGHLRGLRRYAASDFLEIDAASARSLELTVNSSDGSSAFTLLSVLDRTQTAAGARLLKARLNFPLADAAALEARLDQVAALVDRPGLLALLRDHLSAFLDVERLCSRLALDRASPRDLVGLETSAALALGLADLVAAEAPCLAADAAWPSEARSRTRGWVERSARALRRDPAPAPADGPLFQDGFDAELDTLRHARDHSQEVLDAYLAEEQAATGLPGLKLRFNRIIGYYFEVSKARLDAVPPQFRRKQSLVGSERFTTDRLDQLEESLLHVEERIQDRERVLFTQEVQAARAEIAVLQNVSAWVAALDVASSLARTAVLHRYVRPRFAGGAERCLTLVDARHPVVEAAARDRGFVPNNVVFGDSDSLLLLTGPNMAGKSTYLRQTALIVVLGQIGSFVPATEARWSPVDRLFSRVGANDRLARGESTFLVEMMESAHILRRATRASLVLMDEVGRGTGTRDGFSLAWAICEHLLSHIQAMTLFATHFHELTALSHPGLRNASMAVADDGSDVVFLRTVRDGPSDNSYGLHVARLAGVPLPVIHRAAQILKNLPAATGLPPEPEPPGQLSLFPVEEDPLRLRLRALDTDRLTPLEALNLLADLKREAR